MKKYYLGALILVLVFTLVGCGGGGGGGKTGGGTITGSVYAPDNATPIVGASVTVQGTGRSTTTNAQGGYTLTKVPTGSQTIIAIKGGYRAEISATVTEDKTVTAAPLALAPTGKIGVVTGGVWDTIESVLSTLGIAYDVIDDTELQDAVILSQYTAIFFPCGMSPNFTDPEQQGSAEITANLRNFVKEGGSIYISDLVFASVDHLFPDKIEIMPSSAKKADDQFIEAVVCDPEIQALLGKDKAIVYLDIYGWIVIDSVAPGVSVDLQGTVVFEDETTKDNVPLMVHFSHGDGFVVFTSFHNSAQVTKDTEKILKHLVFEL